MLMYFFTIMTIKHPYDRLYRPIVRSVPWLDYDEWQRVLSPQKETKDRWLTSKKTEHDWKIYLDDFNPQMKEAKPVEAIERLGQRVKNGETITLLCYCKPEDHCHRNIIKSLIKGNTSKVKKNIRHSKRG